ncbi:roadblock/LC7 domain-containing protein, partial [Wenyingzhuangia sp. 1_MG-2023]|nr:roadblock/LC7 domain-containing protein [Wenyingzhuangia sp. 1_MG-2023]
HSEIECLCLSTLDGFPVINILKNGISFEADTMAAASSTLYSVSNAVARQILSKPFQTAFIESDNGNIIFTSLPIQENDYILTASATDSMNIGQLRAIIKRIEIRE